MGATEAQPLIRYKDWGTHYSVLRVHDRPGGERLMFLRIEARAAVSPSAQATLVKVGVDGKRGAPAPVAAKAIPKEAPVAFLIEQKLGADVLGLDVDLSWTMADGAARQHKQEVLLVHAAGYNPQGTPQVGLGAADLPRLVVGLNAAPAAEVPQEKLAGAQFELPAKPNLQKGEKALALEPAHVAGLNLILETIAARLEGGLDDVWAHQDRRFPLLDAYEQEARDAKDDVRLRAALEERWARLITEMMDLCPYLGPGLVYFRDDSPSKELPLLRRVSDDADPCYPVVAACQHLCTLAWTSRGVPWTSNVTLQAASATIETIRKDLGGTVHFSPDAGPYTGPIRPGSGLPKATSLADVKAAMRVPGFGPGTVFVFANKGPVPAENLRDKDGKEIPPGDKTPPVFDTSKEFPLVSSTDHYRMDNKSSAHIAFLLRVDRAAGKAQFFDTGGVGVYSGPGGARVDRNDGVTVAPADSGMQKGNFDDPATVTIPMAGMYTKFGDPCRGMGVPPEVSLATLDASVARLKRARPLALARLVLRDRRAKPLDGWGYLYVSPWLRMHRHGAPEQNFSFARYAWSLRNLPGREHIEARWMFESPKDTKDSSESGPGSPFATKVLEPDPARTRTLGDLEAKVKAEKPSYNLKTALLMDLVSQTSGEARIEGRVHATKAFTLGQPLRIMGDTHLSAWKPPARLSEPAYFTQEGARLKTKPSSG